MNKIAIVAFITVVFITLLAFSKVALYWLQAYTSRAPISMLTFIGMVIRKTPPKVILSARICAVQAGIDISPCDLENIFLIRRDASDVLKCVNALIISHKANLDISFEEIKNKHFAGHDVIEMINNMVEKES